MKKNSTVLRNETVFDNNSSRICWIWSFVHF